MNDILTEIVDQYNALNQNYKAYLDKYGVTAAGNTDMSHRTDPLFGQIHDQYDQLLSYLLDNFEGIPTTDDIYVSIESIDLNDDLTIESLSKIVPTAMAFVIVLKILRYDQMNIIANTIKIWPTYCQRYGHVFNNLDYRRSEYKRPNHWLTKHTNIDYVPERIWTDRSRLNTEN